MVVVDKLEDERKNIFFANSPRNQTQQVAKVSCPLFSQERAQARQSGVCVASFADKFVKIILLVVKNLLGGFFYGIQRA